VVAAVVGGDASCEMAVAPGGDPSSFFLCFSVFFFFSSSVFLFFFLSVFSSFPLLFCSFLSFFFYYLPYIYRKNRGERGKDDHCATAPKTARGARPLCFFHIVVGHGSELRQVRASGRRLFEF